MTFLEFANNAGAMGPYVMIILTLFLLRKNTNYAVFYFVGNFLSGFINYIIKGIVRQKRPVDIKVPDYKKNERYGMPSGHANAAFFSTVFVYLATNDYRLGFMYLLYALLIGWQRVYDKKHTITQVIVGSVLGSLLGYMFYMLATHKIKGKASKKQDDNAFTL